SELGRRCKRPLCETSCKLRRWTIPQRAVRSVIVVVLPPGFDSLLRVRHTDEPMLVEAFVPKLAVEALGVGVLRRLSRPHECQAHMVAIGPCVQHLSRKLWAVVDDDAPRESSHRRDLVEHSRDP